jgi:hypothetical protein
MTCKCGHDTSEHYQPYPGSDYALCRSRAWVYKADSWGGGYIWGTCTCETTNKRLLARLTLASTVTTAPVGLLGNENDDGAAA